MYVLWLYAIKNISFRVDITIVNVITTRYVVYKIFELNKLKCLRARRNEINALYVRRIRS